jgi:glutamyl-tRNA reductase
VSSPLAKRLSLLSLTHRTAPLEVREQLAIPEVMASRLYDEIRRLPGIEECVLLATCNRIELYTVGTGDAPAGCEIGVLAALHAVEPEFVAQHAGVSHGVPVIEHLFSVATGLDSQMVGEAEILGQVKDAYADALARGATGPVLNRVFQKGFQAAGWARTHTGIGRGEVSIGNVAVELARRIFGELSESRVLVLGTGEVGEKTAKSFVSRGATDISVASRTFENAHRLAASFGGAAIELPAALAQVGKYDIVVGSSSVEEPLLNAAGVRAAIVSRHGDPLFLIDLGLPRNFDPALRDLDGVFLYNLDDLSAIANENLRARMNEVDKALAGLGDRARRVWEATGLG